LKPIFGEVSARLWIMLYLLTILSVPLSGLSETYLVKLTNRGLEEQATIHDDVSTLQKSQRSLLKFHPVLQSRKYESILNHWYVLESESEQQTFLQNLSDSGYLDHAQPLGFFKIPIQQSDSLLEQQWYLDILSAKEAWTVTKGDNDIIVGVIDTGIDYRHPDIMNRIWINSAEDINANGQYDPSDLNGIDDDNNGFIDDIMGWDFTDAPRFADAGDYQEPDYDPYDEFPSGHGTQIAGIIAAEHNDIGINGLAPGVRIMNLRAGTASGYLEEDDVARGLLYALDNGARIINMSFGDVALSQFLRDVIQYAIQQGAIIIASSGNDATNEVHYPSGLPGVISVGASTQYDGRAGFSNFGNTLDLVAPGSSILSTAPEESYNQVNGTSFSAPFVSATAALLLSLNPGFSSEQIRNIIKTSSEDIFETGWDQWTGSGRLSAGAALMVREAGELTLLQPSQGFSTAQVNLAIIGTIMHPDIHSFELYYGLGNNPSTWQLLRSEEGRQIVQDTLTVFDLSNLPDTTITLRLHLKLIQQADDETRVQFSLDRSPPTIENLKIRQLLDGPNSASLVSFSSDDITSAELYLKGETDEAFENQVASAYRTKNHRIKLDQQDWYGTFEFYIKNTNAAGLETISSGSEHDYYFTNDDPMNWEEFNEVPWTLPAGYLLDKVTDLDKDSRPEIIMSRYSEQGGFGPVEIYEFENGNFTLRLKTGFTAIPRAAGDVDKDGLSDLLLGYGQQSYLLEAEASGEFPTQLIWKDTVQFWAAGYLDADDDGRNELIGRVDSQYILLESSGNNQFTEIARLNNPTAGENRYGVPRVVTGNINGDDHPEIAFGDLDGDFLIYTSVADNTLELLTSGRGELTDASEMITMDEQGHFFVGTHTSEDINYEHEFDARFWLLQAFQFSDLPGAPIPSFGKSVYGYSPTRDYDSRIMLSELDGESVLFVCFFPDIYLFRKTGITWTPVWHYREARSNAILAADLDGNGTDEFYFNNGSGIIGFSKDNISRPAIPREFSAIPLDSNRVKLNWSGNSPDYNVYRRQGTGEFQSVAKIQHTSYMDSLLNPEQFYYYTVTAIDSFYDIVESMLSPVDSVFTSYPPRLENIRIADYQQLILYFNEPVLVQNPDIRRTSDAERANSAIRLENKREVLVTFQTAFYSGVRDSIVVQGITDMNKVPVDLNHNKISFTFQEQQGSPYLETVRIEDRNHLLLYFNIAMDPGSVTDPGNYDLEPSGDVINAIILDSLATVVKLEVSQSSFVGGFGQSSYLILGDLKSKVGIRLSGTSRIHLYEAVDDLSKILVYPQPVKPGHRELIFARLPDETEINIYSISGKLVKTLQDQTFFGGITWNLTDNNNALLPGGVYIYEARLNNKKKLGKLVIVR